VALAPMVHGVLPATHAKALPGGLASLSPGRLIWCQVRHLHVCVYVCVCVCVCVPWMHPPHVRGCAPLWSCVSVLMRHCMSVSKYVWTATVADWPIWGGTWQVASLGRAHESGSSSSAHATLLLRALASPNDLADAAPGITHTCTYIRHRQISMHTRTYAQTHIRTHTHAPTSTRIHMYTYAHKHACARTHTHPHPPANTYAPMRTSTPAHTHTHTRTHACAHSRHLCDCVMGG
jgi:hypothetical protein